MKNKQLECSIVVPVYNSQDSLKLLHQKISEAFGDRKWELILVNDSSKDRSWKVMNEISEMDDRVTIVNLMNNFGQHNATMCGFKFAKGKYVVTMDDDLQNPPSEVIKLLDAIIHGNSKVVYGQYKSKRHGWFRDLCSKWVNRSLAKITGTGYNVTSFRIIDKSVINEIIKFDNYNVNIDVLIKNIVSNRGVGHCKVIHRKRTVGKSNYSFKKLFGYAVNMIFNYTVWPLRIATIFGFLISFFSILLGVLHFIYYLFYGADVKGWTSLMLLITFLSGLILFMLGIFGEYIGNIYLVVSKSPQYIIKNVRVNKYD